MTHTSYSGEFGAQYQIHDDDLIAQHTTLRVATPDELERYGLVQPEADRGFYGSAEIVGRDERGQWCLVIYCDTVDDGRALLDLVRTDRCQECGEPLCGDDEALIVLTAGGDLEWSFHRHCAEDRR